MTLTASIGETVKPKLASMTWQKVDRALFYIIRFRLLNAKNYNNRWMYQV